MNLSTEYPKMAWAAGLFEGEGCITTRKVSDGLAGRLSLAMTDRDVVERFYEIVGTGHFYGPRLYKGQKLPVWTWVATTFEMMQAVIAMVWPWLGDRRRDRAIEVLLNDPRRLVEYFWEVIVKMGTEYSKIETLFDRDKETFKVIADYRWLRWPEFSLVNKWQLTEKVDGTNIRIEFHPRALKTATSIIVEPGREDTMIIRGRTNNADIPPFLLESIEKLVTLEKLQEAFDHDVVTTLYGEGYGARIQKGGGNYRPDTSFRLFDVRVGDWWLNWENVEGIAEKLGIKTVPVIANNVTWDEAVFILRTYGGEDSRVAFEDSGKEGVVPEGIVARTNPLLFNRKGQRLMWKLKGKDF